MPRHRLAILFAAVAAAFTATPVNADTGPHPEFQAQLDSVEQLAALNGEDLEVGYVNRIVPHHQGATDMATTMMAKVVRDELAADLETMVDTQQAEMELLSGYLAETYGAEVTPDQAFMMSPAMMEALTAAEAEAAEIMFLLMIREHHQTAILLGEQVLARDDASEVLRGQAQEMVDAQQEEQAKFAGYLDAWYGIAAPEPSGDMVAAMELAMAEIAARGGHPNTALPAGGHSPLVVLGAALLVSGAALAMVRARRLHPTA